jgi:ATP-binding cassette subfamily B protein
MSLMKRILSVSGRYKGRIQLALIFSFLKSLLAKVPIGLAFVILAAFYNGTADTVLCLRVGIAMAVSLILQILFQHIANRLQAAAGYMVFAYKRVELGAHLRKMPMGYFTEGNIGKISSVLSTDMLFIEENCMNVLADMMSYIFAEAILLIFLFFINPWLGFAASFVVLILVLVARGMHKDSHRHSSIRQEQSENLTEAVLDFIEGIGIIKTYNLLGDKSKELSDNFRLSCKRNIDFEENAAVWHRILNLLYGIGSVMILVLSLYLHSREVLDATLLVGIMLFVFDLFGPIKALYGDSARLTVMSSCLDRIEEVFAETELSDNGKSSIPEKGTSPEVQYKDVSFAYGDKDVLHDINLSISKNTMLALVGPSGGGKSTIASLLARFWDVKSGQVLVRGKDVREVRLGDLMNHISMVFQRVYLFQDTIYNNISMGRPDATEAEVMEAAKKARCYNFIMSLPNGFQTMVGEGGETLSGGEKQRISIARCILKDAPIVILVWTILLVKKEFYSLRCTQSIELHS